MGYTYIPDEYGRPPHLQFDTPMDFVQYVRDLQAGKYPGQSASPGSVEQAQKIAENPDGWIMSGGHPRPQDDWLARNLPWLGPAAVAGGVGLAALAGGGAAAAGGAGASGAVAPTTAGAAGTAGTTAGAAGTTAGATGGALASYGPSAAMQSANMGMAPIGSALPAGGSLATSGGGGGFLSQIGNRFKQDPLGTLGQLGDTLGKGAQGSAEGRRADAYAEAAAGRVNLDALALDQKRAVLRSLLGGVQDASISRPTGSTIPTFGITGGLRPSALSNKEGLMAELERPSPTVRPPVAGAGEKAMGIGGGILGMLGSFGKMRPKIMDEEGIAGNLPGYPRYPYSTPPYNPNGAR